MFEARIYDLNTHKLIAVRKLSSHGEIHGLQKEFPNCQVRFKKLTEPEPVKLEKIKNPENHLYAILIPSILIVFLFLYLILHKGS